MKIIIKYPLLIVVLLATSTTLTAQTLVSVNPDSTSQDQSLAVAITGQDTFFLAGSLSVWFSQGTLTIDAEDPWAVDDTSIIAKVAFPHDAMVGPWNLNVYDDNSGLLLTLPDGFMVNPYNPVLTSTSPSSAYQGQSLTVTITGQNTHFMQGTMFPPPSTNTAPWFGTGSVTTSIVWLTQGTLTIYSKYGEATGDELLTAHFDIPPDANPGPWDVVVPTKLEGKLTLPEGFMVAQPGDWTCDGMVDFFDFGIVAGNWLAGFDE